jgi:hypothetical protein
MQQSHDPDIQRIEARNGFRCYGMGLGIVLLDDVYPGFPGDVRNASAYPFPIQYEIAEDVDIPALVTASDKSPCLPPVRRAEGQVDTLAMHTNVDIVGYGVQGFVRGGGQPGQVFLWTRYYAPSQLIDANFEQSGEYIKLTANPSQGTGGTGFGDSGGPDLLGGTDTILAINSYGTNNNGAGVSYSNRIDLSYALQFIGGYMK